MEPRPRGDLRGVADVGRQIGFYPLEASVDDEVAAARDEVAGLPEVPYPSLASVVANHPGMAGYQVMTDPEYQQAAKYDLLMRRLQAIQDARGGVAYRDSQIGQAIPSPEPLRDRSIWGNYWGSQPAKGYEQVAPYRHRGFLATGQPVRNASELMLIPFSALANNVVRPFLDLDKAVANQPAVTNRSTLGLANLLSGKDPNPDWAEEQHAVENTPFDNPVMAKTQGNPGKLYQDILVEKRLKSGVGDGTVDGTEILGDFGMPEGPLRTALGVLIETPFDPLTTSIGPAIRYLGRASRYAAPAARSAARMGAGRELANEFLVPPLFWTGLTNAPKLMSGE